ncbi:MAG: KH domain-containing protein [Desulfurococcales archaeon]|nr:KH domain-containing protein [Desulfurococcales archaeon]
MVYGTGLGGGFVGRRIHVKVPLNRIGVVIGKGGENIKRLQEKFHVRISVDTENGLVIIEPGEGVSAADMLKAADIVRAMALGFTPEQAFELVDEDMILVVIDLKTVVGDNQSAIRRLKGRVIGEKGRAKRTIEEVTGTKIVVGDYHIGIIGEYERAMAAKTAVEMLLEGRQHSTVYRHLEDIMRTVKRREMMSYWRMRPREE